MKKLIVLLFIILPCLLFSKINDNETTVTDSSEDSFSYGEERINDMKESFDKINELDEDDNYSYSDVDNDELSFFEVMDGLFGLFSSISRNNQDIKNDNIHTINTNEYSYDSFTRPFQLYSAVESGYYYAQTYGIGAKINLNASLFGFRSGVRYTFGGNLNFFTGYILGGLGFGNEIIQIGLNVGGFYHQFSDHLLPSSSIDIDFSLPINIKLLGSGLIAWNKYIFIIELNTSLTYHFNNFGIGIGYYYFDYADTIFNGPTINFTFGF